MIAIGIDIGGCQMRVGTIDAAGRVLAVRHCATPHDDRGDAVIDWLTRAVGDVLSETRPPGAAVAGVGLALPGLLDHHKEGLRRSANLPSLEGRPLAGELAERTGHEVTLITDANAATWGEYQARSPRPQRFVHLRLGTGVACGVVIDGEFLELDAARRGHLDFLVVDDCPEAVTCSCGKHGCLEAIASGPALTERTARAGCSDGLVGLQQAYEDGDGKAAAAIREAAGSLSTAIDNITDRFHPQVICVGGGVTTYLPALLDELTTCARPASTWPDRVNPVLLERARLGDEAGVIGAALLAMRRTPRRTPRA